MMFFNYIIGIKADVQTCLIEYLKLMFYIIFCHVRKVRKNLSLQELSAIHDVNFDILM